jgi:hypothetical protein
VRALGAPSAARETFAPKLWPLDRSAWPPRVGSFRSYRPGACRANLRGQPKRSRSIRIRPEAHREPRSPSFQVRLTAGRSCSISELAACRGAWRTKCNLSRSLRNRTTPAGPGPSASDWNLLLGMGGRADGFPPPNLRRRGTSQLENVKLAHQSSD